MTASLRFSVLVPAYNAVTTVGKAVQDALDQRSADVEVVVCDDGSTDGTAEVLSSFGAAINVVRQANRGLAAARNAALACATGDVVVLLDADDEWHPTRLARIREAFDRDPSAVLVTTDADVVTPGDSTTGWYGTHVEWVEGSRQPVEILRENFIFGSAAVRRDALESIGGFDESLPHGSEYEAWVRLLVPYGRAALVPERLATYNRTPASLSMGDRRSTYRMVLAILERTEADFDLTAEQRHALEDQRRLKQRWLDVLDALDALAGESTSPRDRLLVAAGNGDLSRVKRWLFRAAAAAPGAAQLGYRHLPASLRPAAWPEPRIEG